MDYICSVQYGRHYPHMVKLKLYKIKNSASLLHWLHFKDWIAHVASSYHIGQCTFRTFPWLLKALWDGTKLDLLVGKHHVEDTPLPVHGRQAHWSCRASLWACLWFHGLPKNKTPDCHLRTIEFGTCISQGNAKLYCSKKITLKITDFLRQILMWVT